jgi:DNA-binding response OmpR family regulator
MKILVVEDEIPLLESIEAYLTQGNHTCERASTYQEGSQKIDLYEYDCILLDITLPDGNGLKLLEECKALKRKAGLIIISAKNSLDDKVNGLERGADDYLTKPFHLSELNARIKAVIRRKQFDTNDCVQLANLTIDLSKRSLLVDDIPVNLTKKELDILLHLIANKSHVVTKVSLAEYLWGDRIDQADSFDFLFAHLKNLKKKLCAAQAGIEIKNVYGIGYQLLEK